MRDDFGQSQKQRWCQLVTALHVKEAAKSDRPDQLGQAEQDRQRALSIPRALAAAESEFQTGVTQTHRLTTTIQHILLEEHLSIDYVAAVDAAVGGSSRPNISRKATA